LLERLNVIGEVLEGDRHTQIVGDEVLLFQNNLSVLPPKSLCCALRFPRPFRTSPVDTFEQHRQLRWRQ
jgi:hypothetical protein